MSQQKVKSYQRLFKEEINPEPAKAWRADGKKAVGTICAHVPDEILRAAGILPVRMRATGCTDASEGEIWMSAFSCSFAKSVLEHWLDGTYDLDGIITSDGCLMPSRVYDNAKYIDETDRKEGLFFHQIGAPRVSTELAYKYYVDELEELIGRIEEFTGEKVTDEKIVEYIDKYNEARRLVAEVNELMKAENPVITGTERLHLTMAYGDYPIEEYIDMLKEFLADAKDREPIKDYRARLLLIGSALDTPEYLDIVEEKGGLFVADTNCFGSRPFVGQCEVKDGDVLGSLSRYYLDRLVCPRMVDNRPRLHEEIINLVKEYNCDGVFYNKMQYCECWGGESVLLDDKLKEAGIPLITVEREQHPINAGQLATRAEAFVEMIE